MRPIKLDPTLAILPREDFVALLAALHDVDQVANARPEGQITVSDRRYQWQIGVSENDPTVQVLKVSIAPELSVALVANPVLLLP